MNKENKGNKNNFFDPELFSNINNQRHNKYKNKNASKMITLFLAVVFISLVWLTIKEEGKSNPEKKPVESLVVKEYSEKDYNNLVIIKLPKGLAIGWGEAVSSSDYYSVTVFNGKDSIKLTTKDSSIFVPLKKVNNGCSVLVESNLVKLTSNCVTE